MNVLFITPMYPNNRNPVAGIFVHEQAQFVKKTGIEVTVISLIPWAPRVLLFKERWRRYRLIPSESKIDGVRVIYRRVIEFPRAFLGGIVTVINALHIALFVRRLHRIKRFDIIHSHTLISGSVYAAFIKKVLGIPVICTGHGGDVYLAPFQSRVRKWQARFALRHIDELVATSGFVADKMRLCSGEIRDIKVVFNGADPDIFYPVDKMVIRSQLSLPAKKKIISFVGNLVPIKGLVCLMQAFADLNKKLSDLLLILVGDGSERQNIEELASQLGISDMVILTGQKSKESVHKYIAASDIFVLPSLAEGSPTVLSEAMLTKVPIVASEVGGIPEILGYGTRGSLVPPGDSVTLAKTISHVMKNEATSNNLSDRGYEFALQNLTWKANVEQYINIYESALKRKMRQQ